MADDINKKITIDVEVKSDGQQQIDQYNASFENLRSTISNLSKPLSDNILPKFTMQLPG